MLTSSAMIGIKRTPIEGFPYAKIEALLAEKGLFDTKELRTSPQNTSTFWASGGVY